MRIPNINTFADLLDRLIVEVNKLSALEHRKREEQGKPKPDAALIAKWDNLSRDCCELRSMIKSEINTLLAEIVSSQEYKTMREVRTFRPPATRLADVLARRCREVSEQLAYVADMELLGEESYRQCLNLPPADISKATAVPKVLVDMETGVRYKIAAWETRAEVLQLVEITHARLIPEVTA